MKRLFTHDQAHTPSEGDVYKVIELHGHVFRILYGYYEEFERKDPSIEPMPIYPDFIKNPFYTEEGLAIVTKMQDACPYYKGKGDVDRECADCERFGYAEDLFGICTCEHNKKRK